MERLLPFTTDKYWLESNRRPAITQESTLQSQVLPVVNKNETAVKPSLEQVQARQRYVHQIKTLVNSRLRDQYDSWTGIAANNEIRQLYKAYQLIEQLFTNPAMMTPLDRLTRGGASRGFKFEFTPKRKTDQKAKYKSDQANDICSEVADMLNGNGWGGLNRDFMTSPYPNPNLGSLSARLGKYCNMPLHLAWDKRNRLKKITAMPVAAWKINVDSDLNFLKIDPNKSVYEQKDKMNFLCYDPGNGFALDDGYMAENITWGFANRGENDKYGTPLAYNLSIYVYALNELYKGLPEARKMGNPRTVYFANENMSTTELGELLDSLPEQMAALGYDLGPMSRAWNQILHNVRDAKTLNAGTGAFQEFGDDKLLKDMIAIAFNMQPALMSGAENAPRNTLAFLMRLESAAQRIWMLQVITSVILATFQKALWMAGYEDTTDLNCEVFMDEDKTPEELQAEAEFAEKCKVLSLDGKLDKICGYLSIDPKVEKDRNPFYKEYLNEQKINLDNSGSDLESADSGSITDSTDIETETRMQKFNERKRDGFTTNEAFREDKIDRFIEASAKWNKSRDEFQYLMTNKMAAMEDVMDRFEARN